MTSHSARFAIAMTAAFSTSWLRPVDGQSPVRTVVLSGAPAPGTEDLTSFGSLLEPFLNNAGQTLFPTRLSGSSVTSSNAYALYSEGTGSLELLARQGDQAYELSEGTYFSSYLQACFSNTGSSVLSTSVMTVQHPGDSRAAAWVGKPGHLSLAVTGASPVPGLGNDVEFSQFFTFRHNDAGQIAFRASLQDSSTGSLTGFGIWSGSPEAMSLVARTGMQAPDLAPGMFFTDLSQPTSLPFNATGQCAFRGVAGTGAISRTGIWGTQGGALRLCTMQGQHAPGQPDGVRFGSGFGHPTINDQGDTGFVATLTGTGGASTTSVWSGPPGAPALVAKQGSHAPGTPPGVEFSWFSQPALDESGRTAFIASLLGSGISQLNNQGIWFGTGDDLRLIAREGDGAPGSGPGTVFGWSSSASPFTCFAINKPGQVAFLSSLAGDDVNSANDSGIWATDPAGILRLIAREGDLWPVAPGDSRTIKALYLSTGQGNRYLPPGEANRVGYLNGFNDLGDLAFAASFTDGSSGVFVVRVPEPGAAILWGLALGLWSRRWFRPRARTAF